MLFTWLYLKLRKKSKAVYKKSLVSFRNKIADPEKRKKLNDWFNKMNAKEKSLFHRLYARLYRDVPDTIPAGGEWVLDFAGKPLRMPLRKDNMWLDWDQAISVTGHDPEIKETYANMIRSGKLKVVFDIGANYGTHSLLFLAHGIKTVSFEPISSLKPEFDLYCRMNNLTGQWESTAVGDKNGMVTLWIPIHDTWSATIVEQELDTVKKLGELEKMEVPLTTVDDYVNKTGLRPDFMKIDTEGNEINVLKGAVNTLRDCRPFMIFETNDRNARAVLWDFLAQNQYTIQELPYMPGQPLKPFSREQFFAKGSTNYMAVPVT